MGGRFKSDTVKQSFFVSLVSVTHRHTHTNTHSLLHLARQRCAGDELLICFVRLLWTAIWNKIRGFVLIAAKNKHVWRHFCSWGDLTAEGAQSTWDSSLKLWVEMKIYPFVHGCDAAANPRENETIFMSTFTLHSPLILNIFEFGGHCLHIDTAHLEYVSQLGVFTTSYLFKVSSVNCHGCAVHKPAPANSLKVWGRHAFPKEKPTFLVRSRNTPSVKRSEKGGGYKRTGKQVQHWCKT